MRSSGRKIGACLLLFLSVSLLANAAFAKANDTGEDVQYGSISQIALPYECSRFWEYGWENDGITRIGSIGVEFYWPALDRTPESLGIGGWSPGGKDRYEQLLEGKDGKALGIEKIGASQENARKAADSLAKKSSARALASGFSGVIEKAGDPLNPAGVFYYAKGMQLVSGAGLWLALTDYTAAWKNTTSLAVQALSDGAQGTNKAFMQAQKNADALHEMGAGRASYAGRAKEAYSNWSLFALQAKRWTGTGMNGVPSPNADEQKYAKAYVALSNLTMICSSPPRIGAPLLARAGNGEYALNIMSGSDAQGSLFAIAMRHENALGGAIDAMLEEIEDSKLDAGKSKARAILASSVLESHKPHEFDEPLPAPGFGNKSLEPARISGSISQMSQSAKERISAAGTSVEEAQAHERGKYFAWAANELESLMRARQLYESSNEYSTQALEEMKALHAKARDFARENIAQAEQKAALIANTGGDGGAIAAAMAQQSLTGAKEELERGDESDLLGQGYAHYVKSIKLSDGAIDVLSKPQNAKASAGMEGELWQFKALLEGSGTLLGEEKAGWRMIYEYYEIRKDDANPALLLDLRERLASLRLALEYAAMPEEQKFLKLRGMADSLAGYDSGIRQDFDSDFEQYRRGDAWSDKGFVQFERVKSKLEEWGAKIESISSKALELELCSGAKWNDASIASPSAGSRAQVGGTYSMHERLGIRHEGRLELSCPFERQFASSEAGQKSANVLNAYADGKSIFITLSGVEENSVIFVEFDSYQMQAKVVEDACLLTVEQDGRMRLERNYTLNCDFEQSNVALDSEIKRGIHAQGTGLYLGQKIEGREFDNGTISSMRFTLPHAAKGKSEFSASIFPGYEAKIERYGEQAYALADGSVSVSYILKISELDGCKNVRISIAEPTDEYLQKLGATPLDGSKAALLSSSKNSSREWRLDISQIGEDGAAEFAISYLIYSQKDWVERAADELEAAAQGLSDSYALSQIEEIRRLAAKKDYAQAYRKALALRERLGAQKDDGGAEYGAWQAELDNAIALHNRMMDVARQCSVNSLLSDLAKMNSLNDELGLGMQKASMLAEEGKLAEARASLRQAVSGFESKALQYAQKEISALKKAGDGAEWAQAALEDENISKDAQAISDYVLLARRAASENDIPASLGRIVSAKAANDKLDASIREYAKDSASEQNAERQTIAGNAAALLVEYEDWAAQLSSLDSASIKTIKPSLTLTQAAEIEKKLKKPIGELKAVELEDGVAALGAIEKNRHELDAANNTVWEANATLMKAKEAILRSATSSARVAKVYAAEVIAHPQASRQAVDELTQMVKTLDALADGDNFADRISLSEKISERARREKLSLPKIGGEPPYLIIIATLTLLVAVAYVIFYRKPKKPKLDLNAPQKLSRA